MMVLQGLVTSFQRVAKVAKEKVRASQASLVHQKETKSLEQTPQKKKVAVVAAEAEVERGGEAAAAARSRRRHRRHQRPSRS